MFTSPVTRHQTHRPLSPTRIMVCIVFPLCLARITACLVTAEEALTGFYSEFSSSGKCKCPGCFMANIHVNNTGWRRAMYTAKHGTGPMHCSTQCTQKGKTQQYTLCTTECRILERPLLACHTREEEHITSSLSCKMSKPTESDLVLAALVIMLHRLHIH